MFKFANVRHPRPSLKRLLWGSLGTGAGVVVGAAAGIIGVGLYIVDTLTRPKHLAAFALYTFSPFELGLPAEDVSFPSLHNDHVVNGWYIPHAEATSTIIVSPGYRSTKTDVLGLCALLWKAGHNILVFEYYGHGTVVGMPVTLGYREINDFLGAVAYARKRSPEARLGVVGYSMGAAVSIMGTARSPEIQALVADSAFATHRSVVEYAVSRTLHLPFVIFDWATDLILWWRAGYHFNQVEPLRDIGRITPRPIMLIHGMKDSIVDPHDAALLYKAAGEPKELWLAPDVEHCGVYFSDRAEYVRLLTEFFDLYLKKSPPVQVEITSNELTDSIHNGSYPLIS
ncbi:alpha/beta hydrolase [Dictyobacter arantiisoli]|uniref:Alpha/beta hydrolase n=1 Tax=Dictyobacter arantiisoli TaxID=2014874 RepID=A0A5A5TJD5_9CHLR|nr:alpha/beta hydrolase [Dictyobacter arantiisoli]GCF11355.1 alpha/beta hydrolase [Dictyobacter arantiisoli]